MGVKLGTLTQRENRVLSACERDAEDIWIFG
jgi:hypothetical protein